MVHTTSNITLSLTGRQIYHGDTGIAGGAREAEPTLPSVLLGAARTRGNGAVQKDLFLPPDYLQPVATYDVSQAARSGVAGSGSKAHDVEVSPDDIIVLELADGGTLITSAGRLQRSLVLASPELLGDNQEVRLENLRARSAQASRTFSATVKGVISKVYILRAGIADEIERSARATLGDNAADLGVSWHGTRALMQAIEDKLPRTGLYRWDDSDSDVDEPVPLRLQDIEEDLAGKAAEKPILVFVHGTASSTVGSFGHLRTAEPELWDALKTRYGTRIYGFEHRTLSASPIENAIALANALPRGAHVSLVSHSRGGLVCDLLCLQEFDALINMYAFDPRSAANLARGQVNEKLSQAHQEQRSALGELAGVLGRRELTIERYVRTACPANGTLLASGNFDVFLSGLLTLIGAVPFFFGSSHYSAFKRTVIDIARYRTDPHMVPGIEAQLPDSPLARLLRDAPIRPGIAMAIIAGDVEGGNMLSRLGVLLTDFLLFDQEDNDLVVNTPSMVAGIAPRAKAHILFDRGPHVSHFRYFTNADTRSALRDWLTADKPLELPRFQPLPVLAEQVEKAGKAEQAAARAAASRGAGGIKQPIVVVLPSIMASHLVANRNQPVWFKSPTGVADVFHGIGWNSTGVEARTLFEVTYGEICHVLGATHRVERFPYDWRLNLDTLGERLGEFLDRLLKETDAEEPIRLLAHGMGGLVVRACIRQRDGVMDELMARDGARLIMLGTPNQGTHSMVENLLGKGNALRTLVRSDLHPDMQKTLDSMASFRGALQLLPRPGFVDTFSDSAGGGKKYDYQKAATWEYFKQLVQDPWFGDGCCALPKQDALDEGAWLWRDEDEDGSPLLREPAAAMPMAAAPTLPKSYEKNSIYVFGVARNTVCGVREDKHGNNIRLRLVGTAHGDGVVTWDSGRIGGIGQFYYMPVQHGDLLSSSEHFDTLVELLVTGRTSRLSEHPPAARGNEALGPILYDAAPPVVADADAVLRAITGSSLRNRIPARARSRLTVAVKAMDLRFLAKPIMVGHYEQDPIAGPEAIIDQELLAGDLSKRYGLGLYAGQLGSTTVVLRPAANSRSGHGLLTGAVVAGLGRYEGVLSAAELTEAVHTGALRYLLQVADVLGKEDRDVPLASLLIGYNSSANLSIAASVEALVRGVIQANARFHETTGLNIRIASLDLVELYIDTAITAVYDLRQMSERLTRLADRHGISLAVCNELLHGEGLRQRLKNEALSDYWPRLVVADAQQGNEAPPTMRDRRLGDPAVSGARADKLRFMYVGARARAEAVVHQRQPGLVESLVHQQISRPDWDRNFCRMLFQLMVPHDFKDAARQLDRLVLVLDSQTANLPWELMLAGSPVRHDGLAGADHEQAERPWDKRTGEPWDGKENGNGHEELPLAMKTVVVRQLATTHFRPQVLPATRRTALVIGNPSVAGFRRAFPVDVGTRPVPPRSQPDAGQPDLPNLSGAREEAQAVVDLLGKKIGYKVDYVIGTGAEDSATASEVLAALYRKPWRLLHICGHGVYNLLHADGRRRSGVLLSDGLLITAAEIVAMEVVPDLVFLNCCHAGQIDDGNNGNKLASSIARELIDIGVRCVVVAGWAINDLQAKLFGETFYHELLIRRMPFGEAVFNARKTIWEKNNADITWGAYQAYGDPMWRPEMSSPVVHTAPQEEQPFAAVEEMLDELARIRVRLSHQRDADHDHDTRAIVQHIARLLKTRCLPGWRELPQLHSALGVTLLELKQLKQARQEFLHAIRREDDGYGGVFIQDIERLIDVEAALSEHCVEDALDKQDNDTLQQALHQAEDLSDLALKRLAGLDAFALSIDQMGPLGSTVNGSATPDTNGTAHICNGARNALRGRVWKRKASLRAHLLLAGRGDNTALTEMKTYLDNAVQAYAEAEGLPGSGHFAPDLALNRLALDALTEWHGSDQAERERKRHAAVALAHHCSQSAEQDLNDGSVANALLQPKAQLVEHLLFGTLDDPGEAGQVAVEDVAQAYLDATRNITLKPTEIDAITTEIESIALFFEAMAYPAANNAAGPPNGSKGATPKYKTGGRLRELARRLKIRRGPHPSSAQESPQPRQ
jgi:hypothetical protein